MAKTAKCGRLQSSSWSSISSSHAFRIRIALRPAFAVPNKLERALACVRLVKYDIPRAPTRPGGPPSLLGRTGMRLCSSPAQRGHQTASRARLQRQSWRMSRVRGPIRSRSGSHIPELILQRPHGPVSSSGALVSYGASIPDLFCRTAGYVTEIFNGAYPAELPIQLPTKYEPVINMNIAIALDIMVPLSLLARADEVIE